MTPGYGQMGTRPAPFSLRLTFEERVRLESNADNMPIAAYIKSLVFADDAPKYRKRRKFAGVDEKPLPKCWPALGQAGLPITLINWQNQNKSRL